MKTISTVCQAPPLSRAWVADYAELIRPRMTILVLLTVAGGAWLASDGLFDPLVAWHAVFGTALVAAGASAFNQFLERHSDSLMQRTENRPLPSGRLLPGQVLALGIGLGLGGVAYLLVTLRQPLAAFLAAFTYVTYVGVYTPLKRRTTLNTLVGAVPGALPPVIGWAAVRGSLDMGALALFLILYVWQVPHFLAIAWIYRADYARAGLCMLPVIDRDGSLTSRQMVGYCMVLVPVSLLPVGMGLAGPVYLAGAILLGIGFLSSSLRFAHAASVAQARTVLRASLLYLPALLLLLLLDGAAGSVAWAFWPH